MLKSLKKGLSDTSVTVKVYVPIKVERRMLTAKGYQQNSDSTKIQVPAGKGEGFLLKAGVRRGQPTVTVLWECSRLGPE